mmetsp:Transcript_20730/g.39413  ORF Transcript_20730/g.39413 Transcript_20730/m.39413 type:complete len:92 (-) Transcript_20730:319-594(-)|eukprot:CAMPEP_0114256864 /NCGR_PEP_ID=MMETSP0058-20121206/18405_1 /TAXON_ID=36894 /ORGANISM="Pyramimonas parkeae, CCMP726" /LENGTH=91 /DNA_ID=CAMNT_0001371509 /DNA_START=285 /DNA_END=560 /DNA_ORIENTATION=-
MRWLLQNAASSPTAKGVDWQVISGGGQGDYDSDVTVYNVYIKPDNSLSFGEVMGASIVAALGVAIVAVVVVIVVVRRHYAKSKVTADNSNT